MLALLLFPVLHPYYKNTTNFKKMISEKQFFLSKTGSRFPDSIKVQQCGVPGEWHQR
jgi:hypothetical protein